MTQLPLHEEQVAAGTKVRQVTVRVSQKLHAGSVAEAAGTEDPDHAAVETCSLEGTAAIVEQ
jgi:hypothetical protein